MDRNYFAAIELNSIYSSCLVMTYVNDQLHPVAYDKVLTNGFADGNIVDSLLFENTVSKLLDEIKRKFKIEVDEAILVLPNNKHSISTVKNRFKVKTERLIIHKLEINQCREEMKKSKVENDKTVIQEVPVLFELDNNRRFRTEPLNSSSSTIDITSHLHYLPTDLVSSHVDELNKNNVRVLDAYINCECSSYATSKKFELEDNTICIDIGQDTTTIAIYSQSLLTISSKVNFGVKQIIESLQISLNVSFAEALILFDSYFISNLDLASEIIFDEERNLNEKRISGIVLNCISKGVDQILNEINILKERMPNTVMCNYILSGLLNEHEAFVDKFIELSNLPVIAHNFDVVCIDDSNYQNCYGAIKLFIDNHSEYVKDRLSIDELDNLSNPIFEVDEAIKSNENNNFDDSNEEIDDNKETKKENKRVFKDIFDD